MKVSTAVSSRVVLSEFILFLLIPWVLAIFAGSTTVSVVAAAVVAVVAFTEFAADSKSCAPRDEVVDDNIAGVCCAVEAGVTLLCVFILFDATMPFPNSPRGLKGSDVLVKGTVQSMEVPKRLEPFMLPVGFNAVLYFLGDILYSSTYS